MAKSTDNVTDEKQKLMRIHHALFPNDNGVNNDINEIQKKVQEEIARIKALAKKVEQLRIERMRSHWLHHAKDEVAKKHFQGPFTCLQYPYEMDAILQQCNTTPEGAVAMFLLSLVSHESYPAAAYTIVQKTLHADCLFHDESGKVVIRRHTKGQLDRFKSYHGLVSSFVQDTQPTDGYKFDHTDIRFGIEREDTTLVANNKDKGQAAIVFVAITGVMPSFHKKRQVQVQQQQDGVWAVRYFGDLLKPVQHNEEDKNIIPELFAKTNNHNSNNTVSNTNNNRTLRERNPSLLDKEGREGIQPPPNFAAARRRLERETLEANKDHAAEDTHNLAKQLAEREAHSK
eukprot:m.3485 g.3485  ORF g.3485 m.3485 type:complete len:344 (+) comp2777_c0_seq2:143-1174(+)